MQFIKHLAELDKTDLPIAGGKGANLGALIKAGLPVPDGFVITTAGYRTFVALNSLDMEISQILQTVKLENPSMFDSASNSIRTLFSQGKMPASLREEIIDTYLGHNEGGKAVAVRSSATAEDLPDLSFAGQQDTFLNIIGESALLDAVVRCWASLWTARAIGYRMRNAISHADVALAVVVQQMVHSQASGVLFTANPVTGRRAETVIDAIFGLGEALVSGQVEPDHYVVENTSGKITSKNLGAKALSIVGQTGGGTVTIANAAAARQAIADEQIGELTRLGQQSQEHFRTPQDMEWAYADGQLYVVQSRAVTSLYPLPATLDETTLEILLSFGVWQGMLDPYTPLGQEVFKYLVVGFSRKFGGNETAADQRVLLTAGERIFVNLTSLLRNKLGRTIAQVFLGAIDPETAKVVDELLKDPRFSMLEPVKLQDRINFLRAISPLVGHVITNMLSPVRGRKRLENRVEELLEGIRSHVSKVNNLSELADLFEEYTMTMPGKMMHVLVGAIAGGQAPYQILLRRLNFPGSQNLLFDLARGLPHNVTTQMDLQLWETARSIKADETAAAYFQSVDTETLVAEYWNRTLPVAAQAAIAKFLERYGIRGVAEIDLGRPRWCENPSNLFRALKSYLQIDPSAAPDVMFQKGIEKAAEAERQILVKMRQQPGGYIQARLVKALIRRFRELGGLRESPKFFVVRLLSIYRYALLAEGQKLVTAETLTRADDVMFLKLRELQALGAGDPRDWKTLVADRRSVYEREMRRTRIPRILLSDGTSYYDAPSTLASGDPHVLTGSPVSAGVVEGRVRVVLDPHGVEILPGEILVCPATDPAWTPLFLATGGLITEVGGMMTHGSVVAREYGIPAVVGVSQATEHLQTGQLVRVDGSTGTVEILES